MPKRTTIGSNPLDTVIPGSSRPSQKLFRSAQKPKMSRITFLWPLPLIEKFRDTVYWTPGSSMAGLVEQATADLLTRLEKKHGKPFPSRRTPLKAGRKIKV
jgi:hypothetical protein